MTAFYSEHDAFAAAWLCELITAGLIAPGIVDERDIQQVTEDDLEGFTQVHLFAGIGGWSLALRLAGWPDDRPVWTGSCPCQPFSSAGKQKANADDRHLWPEMFRLVRQCKPAIVFGEQVEGAIRHGWLDGISADLEGEGYAVGAVVFGAHSVGAPHIRQRLWWLADSQCARVWDEGCGAIGATSARVQGTNGERQRLWSDSGAGGDIKSFGLANTEYRRSAGRESGQESRTQGNRVDNRLEHAPGDGRKQGRSEPGGRGIAGGCSVSGMVNAASERCGEAGRAAGDTGAAEMLAGADAALRMADTPRATSARLRQHGLEVLPDETADWDGASGARVRPGFWSRFNVVYCRDGKYRRIPESGIFPLVASVPRGVVRSRNPRKTFNANASSEARAARLRGYGNAICVEAAAEFIRALVGLNKLKRIGNGFYPVEIGGDVPQEGSDR